MFSYGKFLNIEFIWIINYNNSNHAPCRKISSFVSPHRYDNYISQLVTWWRHQMETFSSLLAICAGNSPVPGEFPAQRPVTRSIDVFFDLPPNKRLSKQWWGWWFETLSCLLWHHRNDTDSDDTNTTMHEFSYCVKLILRDALCTTADYFKQFQY